MVITLVILLGISVWLIATYIMFHTVFSWIDRMTPERREEFYRRLTERGIHRSE